MKNPTIIEAAQQLGVCHFKLYAALRCALIIGSKNLALPSYIQQGYFQNASRGFQLPGTKIMRQYTVSTVTPKGMSLLQEIIDAEVAAGRELRSSHAADSRTARAS